MNLRYYNAFKTRAFKYWSTHKSFKTNRKIIVIESDDWGSIRMPSRETYHALLKAGLRVDQCHYCKNDSIATIDDFNCLFDLLLKFKDKNGNPPIITANSVVANPDFKKIKEAKYEKYFYELLTETLTKYPDTDFSLWEKGKELNIFYPQFHGREHLNIFRWIDRLKEGSKETRTAFDYDFFGISTIISNEKNPSFMAALDADSETELLELRKIIEEGLSLFNDIFKYSSKSFIAPNYIFPKSLEPVFKYNGIDIFQGNYVQKWKKEIQYNFTGKRNEYEQVYLVRNVLFEPSACQSIDWVDKALSQINKAFSQKQPAIICSHRVNFIGRIFKENRDNNLFLFRQLLQNIFKKWPDVEFMSSDKLGELIVNEQVQ